MAYCVIGLLVLIAARMIRLAKHRNLIAVLLASAVFYLPRQVPGLGGALDPNHAGMAPSDVTLYLALPIMLLIMLALPVTQREHGQRYLVLLGIVLMAVAIELHWGSTPARWSGLLSWATAVAAWFAGRAVAGNAWDDRRSRLLLAWLVAGFVLLQLLVGVLQASGILTLNATDQGLLRVRGTFGHAGDLGKVLVACVAITLPSLANESDERYRRLAYFTLGASFVLIGLSASRANLLAILVMIIAWALIARNRQERMVSRRMVTLGTVAMIPFVGTYLLRLQADPNGGSRPQLMEAAWEQMARTPYFGVGPNSYVQTVGIYDAFTARGLPVHNALMLAAVELGLIAIFVIIFFISARTFTSIPFARQESNVPARVLFGYGLAVIVLSISGWGMLKITVLPAVLFVAGFLAGAARRVSTDRDVVGRENETGAALESILKGSR
ncbi:O-antigen ligase family protein [Nocardioides ochotonae]|uniref:O-antigen ligase family protein n=1 Tax=Nocardioides ochotonae TaxID=2685869 RepID=UPI0014073C4D|nr:O-antigen ligase family protein [Nocardioides ochotonae]